MPSWAPALTTFVRTAQPVGLTWMLVGSAATALHGVAGITPGDVDVLVHPDTPDAVIEDLAGRLTRLLASDAVHAGDELDRFVSTPHRPLLHAGPWTFGRWYVDGTKLEVARIREHLEDGPLETHGRPVWAHARVVTWGGLAVPAVPLEVQWATMTLRGQADRLTAVARTPGLRWDLPLARAALRARGLDPDEHPDHPDAIR